MMSWAQAFHRLWWIPTLLFILFAGVFIYVAVNGELHRSFVQLCLILFILFIVLLYLPQVVYLKYPERTTYITLACFGGLFAFGALKGFPLTDATRSFIEARIDLPFFTGFLTVYALLIAAREIFRKERAK